MACAYSMQKPTGFRKLALDCCIASITQEPPSLAAQGVITRLVSALEPKRENWPPVLETLEGILFEASVSGSWVATAELAKLNHTKAMSARRIHKINGGYNTERIERHGNQRQSKPFSIRDGYLDISLQDLKQAEVSAFASLSPFQLCREEVDMKGNTLLHLAAMLGRDDLIRQILQIDPVFLNKQNKAGETPLYKACAAGHDCCIEVLLSSGADPSISQADIDISCLHWLFLIEKEHVDRVINLLVQYGASVSSRTTGFEGSRRLISEAEHFPFHWPNGTPFHWACHVGSLIAAQALLKHGAEVDEPDMLKGKETQRALDLAMIRVDSNMVAFLLHHGADPRKRERGGFTALHLLAKDADNLNMIVQRPLSSWGYLGSLENSLSETKRCVELFRQYGGDLDALGDSSGGSTALVYAALSGDSHAILGLIEAGANANIAETWSGRLPLYLWLQNDPERIAYPASYFPALKALTRFTEDLGTCDTIAGSSLLHAILHNDGGATATVQIIKWLCNHAPQLLELMEVRDANGVTPLLLVIQNLSSNGEAALILSKLLLELGADSTVRDADGGDFVWWLTRNSVMPEASCLLTLKKHMADLDGPGKRELLNNSRNGRTGCTALMNMVGCVFPSCVEYALELGTDLTAHDKQERTALDIALDLGNMKRMHLLQRWVTNMHMRPQDIQPRDAKDFLFQDVVAKPDLENGIVSSWSKSHPFPGDCTKFPSPAFHMYSDTPVNANVNNFFVGYEYEMLPRIIQMLIDAGAQTGSMRFTTGARYHDRTFVQDFEAPWFQREKQPFYHIWAVLYDYDDEQDHQDH